MTDEMKKLNRMIEVMNAYRKGEFIQSRCMDTDNWTDEDKPSWNWGLFDYRIKPEPEKNERRVRIMKARELKDWIEGVDDDADVVIKVTNKEGKSDEFTLSFVDTLESVNKVTLCSDELDNACCNSVYGCLED